MRAPARALLLALLVSTACRDARPPVERPRLTAWVVDWNDALLREALGVVRDHHEVLSQIDLFRFRLTTEGDVVATRPLTALHRRLLDTARAYGLSVVATVVNDTVGGDGKIVELKDAALVERILRDDARRVRLARRLAAVAREEGLDGIDLDFEGVTGSHHDRFLDFVSELAGALRADGKRLIVTVTPPPVGAKKPPPTASTDALAELAALVDEVRVMAYHHHHPTSAPGPSAPVEWLDAVVDHTRDALPAEKLSIALYAGGWQWRSGRREQLTASEAVSLAKNLGAMLEWSENADAVHFHVDGAKGGIEVWYEDACSLVRKVERVRRAGVRTVALWHLGKQDPELFSALRAGRCERPPTRP